MRFASAESGQVNRENGVDEFAEFATKVGLTLRGGGVGTNTAFGLFHDSCIGARGLKEGVALNKRGEPVDVVRIEEGVVLVKRAFGHGGRDTTKPVNASSRARTGEAEFVVLTAWVLHNRAVET